MSYIFTNITHELLTPLTVISASVERLRSQEPKYDDDYDLMQLNIERMVRLLQQILETSKSQAGELKLRVAHGDVMQYVRQTALCIEPLMAKRELEFSVSCQPESMMGWIDTDKLDKIIYNLLSNAAKYTTGENGKVSLTVQTNKTYDRIIIQVRDNGVGISEQKQKRLFQRFYDGDYRRMRTMGHGLGLALTRELVFLHGGTIECSSKEGVGTTFTVVIPINKESFSKAQIDETHKIDITIARTAILDLATRMKSKEDIQEEPVREEDLDDIYQLLVVEDNVELLMLMQQLLGQKYRVKTALNGEEALKIIAESELDLIVSDVMMPVMDGYELTRRVKGDPNTSHLPIILLTAKTQNEDREEALLLGADSFVTKPFKIGDLELRINNIIENRRRIRREFKAQTAEQLEMLRMGASAGMGDGNRESLRVGAPAGIALATDKDARDGLGSGMMMEPKENGESTADQEFLKRALDIVQQHLDDSSYDRNAFARDMGASTSTLYNRLRSMTGMNVSSFIRDIRMKEACRIARQQPDIRISDLAYKVGFQDPKYFSTCFKKEFGVQPSEYIESLSKDQ